MYKLIISDFDGTLAGADGIMSDSVVHAIQKWQKAGNHFSIASGKQYLRLKEQTEDKLKLTDPIIGRGGAEIVDPLTDKVLLSVPIEDKIVSELILLFEEHKISYLIEKENFYYKPSWFNFSRELKYLSIKSIDDLEVKNVLKFTVFSENIPENVLHIFMKEHIIKKYPTLHIASNLTPRSHLVYDITSNKATKHLGALHLIKHLKLDPSQVVGVGDGMNDYPLLTAVGYKVAMGSAPQELKAIADFIVPSYKEDGVAVLIHQLLEKK